MVYKIKESTPNISSLWRIPSVKVLEYTYSGDVPISPYTIPRLWNAKCKITDQLTAFKERDYIYIYIKYEYKMYIYTSTVGETAATTDIFNEKWRIKVVQVKSSRQIYTDLRAMELTSRELAGFDFQRIIPAQLLPGKFLSTEGLRELIWTLSSIDANLGCYITIFSHFSFRFG